MFGCENIAIHQEGIRKSLIALCDIIKGYRLSKEKRGWAEALCRDDSGDSGEILKDLCRSSVRHDAAP